MTRYLLSVHTSADDDPASMTAEQMSEAYRRISAVEGEMRAAGALVFSGRLEEPHTAKVVRAPNGATTDGPFLETKEAIGGFYIIQAETDEDALEWAAKTSSAVGMPIELRPFLDSRG